MRNEILGLRKTDGFRKIAAAVLSVMLALLAPVRAIMAQTGAVVTSGAADIARTGNVTNINQSTDRAAINWQTFNIRPEETVNFNQPGASSVTLNRVIGNERSILEGALNANGQVFLINSGGILLTKGASVNTGGFLASTLNITDDDFNAGRYVFQSDGKGNGQNSAVINQGTIATKNGGYAALLGSTVSNQGIIRAEKGTVALASGDKIRLNFAVANGVVNSLLGIVIDEGTLNALVENKSAIIADGGQVYLTAKAANELYQSQVNTSGLIQARTISDLTGGDLKGGIEIYADGGTANIDGTIDASAQNGGNGGFIETSGDAVKITDRAVITTKSANGKNGEWLIDPDGFTVGLTTNDGDMTAAALNANLANGNVTIASMIGRGSNGNININGAVSWSQNTLTLNATNNVYVNNVMTATGTAGLTANYGTGTNADETAIAAGLYTVHGDANSRIDFSGTGTLKLNNEVYTVINNASQLTAARNNPTGRYALGSNLNLSSITNWTALDNNAASGFTGVFNGFGHEISNFTGAVSFFGNIGNGANVSNLRFTSSGVTVNSARNSAGFLADVNRGNVINVGGGGLTLNATGVSYAGGFVGINHGLIAQSYGGSVGNITNTTGGLVGLNESTGRIIDSYSTGMFSNTNVAVTRATGYVGGLVGINNGTILRSYATGSIMMNGATDYTLRVGGFVGRNNGTIRESYTTVMSYSTAPQFGGFAGENTGLIENAYSTRLNNSNSGSTAANWDAGFVYSNTGTIRNAYATMLSTNTNTASGRYGFAWSNTGTLENVYWYAPESSVAVTEVQATSGATRLTSSTVNNFASYNFGAGMSAIWGAAKSGMPILRNIPVNVYTRSEITYGSGITAGLTITGLQGGDANTFPFTTSYPSGGTYLDAGAWNAADVFNGVYTNVNGIIRVNPRYLTISGVVENKVYDGTTDAVLRNNVTRGGLEGFAGYETLNITYTSAEFQDKNAGNGRTVNLTYNVSDGANGGKVSNYVIATTTMADITPRPVNISIIGNDKIYDGTIDATVTAGVSGAIAGDNLSASYTSAVFNNRNVGNRNVTVNGITLSGADAGNYTLTGGTTRTTMAFIDPLPLTFYGMTNEGSPLEISADSLTATNIVDGDSVTLGGSVRIAASNTGSQPITDFSRLTVNNPNYTVVGSVGNVIVGGANLVFNNVSAGSASINTAGKTTTVTQTTDKAVIDWMRFSIGADETLIFNQPSANAVVLNRVITNLQSVIDGALRANGRVFILTGGGVLFTANSSVNVGGLLAGTFNITNEDFLNGRYVFTVARGNGSVISEGDIVIADGGFVVLSGIQNVRNTGKITGGNMALLASSDALELMGELTDISNGEYNVGDLTGAVTTGGTVNLKNGGILGVAGDTVTLSDGFSFTGVNGGAFLWEQNGDITIGDGYFTGAFVRATLAARDLSLTSRNGNIAVNNAIDWSANTTFSMKAGNDIFINKSIKATGANAGLMLTTGGDYHLITPATFSGAVLDATGKPAARQMPAGTEFSEITLSGANAKLKINDNTYTLIRTMDDLAAIDGKTGYFALMNNLDASAWSRANMGAAAVVGTMSGTLAGMGHTVSNLTLNAPDKAYVGLIGYVTSDGKTVNVLRDIGVLNVDITGSGTIGALVGSAADTVINHAYSTGKMQATSAFTANGGYIGGLAGAMNMTPVPNTNTWSFIDGGPRIENSFSGVSVTAKSGNIGGLVGYGRTITIVNSHTTGNVTCTRSGLVYANSTTGETVDAYDASGRLLVMPSGWILRERSYPQAIGGLLGGAAYANVNNSYASGNVTTPDGTQVGGLVGTIMGTWTPESFTNAVTNSFATGNVMGRDKVGGLIGDIGYLLLTYDNPVTVDNSYATGMVIGTRNMSGEIQGGIGGLVGFAQHSNIGNSWATGNVIAIGGGYAGGLVGRQRGSGDISDSYATGTIVGNRYGGLVGGTWGVTDTTVSGNSYYSNARAGATAETAPARSETGSVVVDIQTRKAENVRNAVSNEQTGSVAGSGRSTFDQYIRYEDSDDYSARVKAISVEDEDGDNGECSEDDDCK